MGGGTTKVGDPSLRSDERPLLSDAEIAANSATMRGVFAKYLDYGPGGALMLDNADWLDDLNYLTFLRDIGRHFSVNRMLSFESVKARLDRDQSLSLPRVQLHDPAGLRLPRAPPPRGLPPADGRLRPVGQHRQRHRPHPPGRRRRGLRPDLAAARHRRRRQDGQDRRRRRLAQRRDADRPTTSGSSGATPPTPTSAASSSSTPSCRSRNATASARLGGAEINAAKILLANEVTRLCHGAGGRRRRRGDGARCLRATAASATTSRR